MWLPEDRDAALTWQTESALRHVQCGTSPWEFEDNPDAWFADHFICEGCRRRQTYEKRLLDAPSADDHAGAVIALYRTPREED